MVKVYNIINDKDFFPILNTVQELEEDNKSCSIERSVELLNQYCFMNLLSIEHAYIMAFDHNMNIKGVFLVSVGNTEQCYFYKKNIGMFLLLVGAEKFILYHNHPNGDLKASDGDMMCLGIIQELANLLEIKFINSVIISRYGWRTTIGEEGCEYDEEDVL